MRVEVFSICDAATNDANKLNILGIFDAIWAAKVPVLHPQCAIALRIRFDAHEVGEHTVAVSFMDADGKHVIPSAQGVIQVTLANGQRSGSADLILNIQSLRLESFGEHSIDLAIDGANAASLPLFVKKRQL